MIYSGVNYQACTQRSTSGWCATSAYENTQYYASYKYCEASDWAETTSSASTSDNGSGYSGYGSGTTVTGEDCVPMTYGGTYYEGCTSDDKYGWCATSTTSSGGSYSTWAYCGKKSKSNIFNSILHYRIWRFIWRKLLLSILLQWTNLL